jgi:hypothetical protein
MGTVDGQLVDTWLDASEVIPFNQNSQRTQRNLLKGVLWAVARN